MRFSATGIVLALVLAWTSCSTEQPVSEVFSRSPQSPAIGVGTSDASSGLEDWAIAQEEGSSDAQEAQQRTVAKKIWRTHCGDGIQGVGEFCFDGHSPPLKLDEVDDIRSLSLGDWDGDGLPDLLLTRVSTRSFQILGSTADAPFSKLLYEEEMPGIPNPTQQASWI